MNVNELPQYKCHKVVRAGRIHACFHSVIAVQVGNTKAIVEFDVGREWVTKHQPERDGYFVVYEDGYQSYSPAAAFEAGYHLVETGTACGGTEAPADLDSELKAANLTIRNIAEGVGVDLDGPLPDGPLSRVILDAISVRCNVESKPLQTDMPPHQLRVLEELAELSLRLEKLTAFFDTELYRSLDVAERNLLKEQSLFMQEYQRVLAERAARF